MEADGVLAMTTAEHASRNGYPCPFSRLFEKIKLPPFFSLLRKATPMFCQFLSAHAKGLVYAFFFNSGSTTRVLVKESAMCVLWCFGKSAFQFSFCLSTTDAFWWGGCLSATLKCVLLEKCRFCETANNNAPTNLVTTFIEV